MVAKKSISRVCSVLFVIIFILAGTPLHGAHAAGIRYAKPTASGSNDCSSWDNACTLQTALTGATSGTEIWVMAGTHKPTTDANKNTTFQLKNGVAVYGGFDGTETGRGERDASANITILSGEINQAGNSDNSYHVVTGATGATLDGFTITAGNASDNGGGMYNDSSSPILANLTFNGNTAAAFGGGMANQYGSSPTLTNVTFSGNSAISSGGGGMFNNAASNPTLTNVTFSGNLANFGAGMSNSNSNPTLTNVTFSGNSATGTGGGMLNSNSDPIIRDSLIWGNTANAHAQIDNTSSTSTPSVNDSVIQDGCPEESICTNVISTDPKLGTLGNNGGSTQTIPIQSGSSAIDSGNDSTCASKDQRGINRPQGEHCDMGAYEKVPTPVLMAIHGGLTSGVCESWATACELRYVLASAVPGQEIWVATGSYEPTAGADRSVTFQLKNGVALYGGFIGTETNRSQRDYLANHTTLSGDLGERGKDDNSYHVVRGATGATLDGFTILAGNANGSYPNERGGGMNNADCNPTLRNITFQGNSATYGGGMYNDTSSPILTDITFVGNSAGSLGGGMFNDNGSNPTLTKVTFYDNSAELGFGGGMSNSSSNPLLINVTFGDNSAIDGGAIYNSTSNPMLTNITFSDNSATNSGGGIYNDHSNPTIRNTIFWGNTADVLGAQIYDILSTSSVSYSVVQGSWSGSHILATDPLLGTLGYYGGFTQTIPIQEGSSAIDAAGSNCPARDQRGRARSTPNCDIGAFELGYSIYLPQVSKH